ncbi:MAG: hypothetical protein JNM93_09350 [Bacteriovoracaceae bacterium]|nr:hypothetical protein [Bacteriovoracaceae bacterium]
MLTKIVISFFLLLYFLLRIILSPFIFVANFVVPFFKKRQAFERKNLTTDAARSFRLDGQVADVQFEVSSEGELEQVRPLLTDLLLNKAKVEVVYFSESLENAITRLITQYPENLRVLRFPILTLSPWRRALNHTRWSSAKTLVLCRYDFFPELIFYGMFMAKRFVLASATVRSTRTFNPRVYLFSLFDLIIAPLSLETKMLQEFAPSAEIMNLDFRVLQVQGRLKVAGEALKKRIPLFTELKNLLSQYPMQNRLMLGSFWPHEAALFTPELQKEIQSKQLLVMICPHRLDAEAMSELYATLKKIINTQIPVVEITEKSQVSAAQMSGAILILNMKGVLVEMYTEFGHAYVGGGFGRSVHSVLEPYLAGCLVYCGPKNHRSTEFTLIQETSPELICQLDDLGELYDRMKKKSYVQKNLARENLQLRMSVQYSQMQENTWWK